MAFASNSVSFGLCVFGLGALFVRYVLATYLGYWSIPGPLLAPFTNFVRLYWTWGNRQFDQYIALHRKYGKLVRIGPNVFSISDPAEIPNIYGYNYKFGKSDFYRVMLPCVNGEHIFGTISPMSMELHKKIKHPLARIFATGNMLQFEEFVDNSIGLFFQQIDDLFLKGQPCDLTYWSNLFVSDTMGELTFSTKYGHLQAATDVDNIIANNDSHFQRASLIGEIPWYDMRLKITPLISRIVKMPVPATVAFQMRKTAERQEQLEKGELPPGLANRDLLSQFLRAEAADPTLPPGTAMQWTAGNIGAGSGTTAVTLTALIYYIMHNPVTYKTLMSELKNAKLSHPPTWIEREQLPYLEACIREAERLFPGVGMHLERVVPKGGAMVCGRFLGEGTVIGMNPWVVNRDREIFGEDADVWRPERWLGDSEKRSNMRNSVLTFGAGSRVCPGIAIARLILFKSAASLFMTYKITLVDEEAWQSQGRWFTSWTNAFVKFEKL